MGPKEKKNPRKIFLEKNDYHPASEIRFKRQEKLS